MLSNIMTLISVLEVTQGHRKRYDLKVWYGFLFAFRNNYGSILYRFREREQDTGRKSLFFHILYAFTRRRRLIRKN